MINFENLFNKKTEIKDGSYHIEGVPFFTQRLDEETYEQEGFESSDEAKHWSSRICGIACLKMVLLTKFPEKKIPLKELLSQGKDIGAYEENKGWIHRGLVNLGKKYGIEGGRESVGDDIEKIAKHIQSKELVIASVTVGFEAGKEYKLEDGSSYIMPKGGHLVVIYGVDVNDGKVVRLLLHHPSSEEDYEWQNRIVSREEFLNSFSSKGNIIYFSITHEKKT